MWYQAELIIFLSLKNETYESKYEDVIQVKTNEKFILCFLVKEVDSTQNYGQKSRRPT